MSIPVECLSCGYEYRVAADLAGKCVKCPECKTSILVMGGQGQGNARSRLLMVSAAAFAVLLIAAGSIGLLAVLYPSKLPFFAPSTCKELAEYLERRGMSIRWMNHPIPTKLFNRPSIVIVRKNDPICDRYTDSSILADLHLFKHIVVSQLPTVGDAKDVAGSQRNAFAYGRFVISGDEGIINEIRSKL
jgi:hypothetical protein